MNAYQDLKNALLANPEVLLLFVAFLGSTIHAVRNRQIALGEGLIGAFTGFFAGTLLTLVVCFTMDWELKNVWFIGFIVAYLSNYAMGGLDTLGKKLQDSPLESITAFVSAMADVIMEKINKLKTPK